MARPRPIIRITSNPTSESSSSSSPERAAYDDTDFFMAQPNDSQSSLGVSTFRDMTVENRDTEECHSPIDRLPPELLIAIFAKLASSPADLRNCMLVSKAWARNSVDLLWHRPLCNEWNRLVNVIQSVRKPTGLFLYSDLVKRLNLSNLGEIISDGSVKPLEVCRRVERLTLTGCHKLTDLGVISLVDGNRSLLALDVSGVDSITDRTLLTVANNSVRLQGLNITGCNKVTDDSLVAISENCRYLKRLKLNYCSQLTDRSIIALAENCPHMLEIDLHDCKLISGDSVTALISKGRHLRELRLAHCSLITDEAFLNLPDERTYESLRILDLTNCEQLRDEAISKIVTAAPRLRNLVLAKCRQLTDRAIMSITRLGKNLHYVHLGHCQHITDTAVVQLVKSCNRIRYIDLACCHRLTDTSVQQLATLPKLRRIGLVKCQAITDRSILALAKAKPGPQGGVLAASSLERVHLSYCVHLTLQGIHALLNHCPRLTHLSLTGVQAFLREELTVFCREAPPEFNEHQRDVFCVFSGDGVKRLRNYLNQEALQYETDGTMYDDNDNDLDDNNSVSLTHTQSNNADVVNHTLGHIDPHQHHHVVIDGNATAGAAGEQDQGGVLIDEDDIDDEDGHPDVVVAGMLHATALGGDGDGEAEDLDDEFGEESELGVEEQG
ncbi:MAG: hypothetical protein M1819_003849 [Sarea resinae]|nr:MAG: hypothetical protein M1819_003849 [Sarea resinae]